MGNKVRRKKRCDRADNAVERVIGTELSVIQQAALLPIIIIVAAAASSTTWVTHMLDR